MIIHHDFSSPATAQNRTSWQTHNPETLFVGFGFAQTLSPFVLTGPEYRHLAMSRLMKMGRAEFHRHLPRQIFAPLISEHFDALDLVQKLSELTFTGKLRALTSRLPNPSLVCREIAMTGLDVDFDILEIDGLISARDIIKEHL